MEDEEYTRMMDERAEENPAADIDETSDDVPGLEPEAAPEEIVADEEVFAQNVDDEGKEGIDA